MEFDKEKYIEFKKGIVESSVIDNYKKFFEVHDLNSENRQKIMSIKPSVYYIFDGYISENVGSDPSIRNFIVTETKINESLKINHAKMIDMPNPTHSTILYKFEYDNRTYLYYSNTGLGINKNQYFDIDEKIV